MDSGGLGPKNEYILFVFVEYRTIKRLEAKINIRVLVSRNDFSYYLSAIAD